MPADDLEAILQRAVDGWRGRYLTDEDLGPWKGYLPLVWDAEPTVEEIARRLWDQLRAEIPDGLVSLAVVESTEFDRSRTVRLSVRGVTGWPAWRSSLSSAPAASARRSPTRA